MAKVKIKKNPVAADEETQARKEYLIITVEVGEYQRRPRGIFTIKEIAQVRRIPSDVYKRLMKIDLANGRYVYLNEGTMQYEQTDKYFSDSGLELNETMIDLYSPTDLRTESFGS